jgi:sulfite exporter TauE/SafE
MESMAAHFGSNAQQDRPGRGALVTAALAGAIFGGLAVAVITGAVGNFATGGLSGAALAVLAGLLLLMVGLNLWARRDARRRGREIHEMLAQGFAQNEQARRRATELQSRPARQRENPVAGHTR